MRRLSANFNGDECMANKFDLLRKLLQHYDPEFFNYLEQQDASDLLFCYRWLLLELKREFKLDNALYMLECSWAAMPPKFYFDLPMYDKKFIPTEDENLSKTTTKTTTASNDNKKSETIKEEESKMTLVQEKSSPRPVKKIEKKTAEFCELDGESVNSSKTLSNSLSFKTQNQLTHNHFTKLKESNNVQDNIKNLKHEMTNAASKCSDLGKQLTSFGVCGVNQIKKSVNEVANVASEFYNNLNNQQQNHHHDHHPKSSVRSTLKGLKLSSVEEQLACKREKFHQQNTTGHSVSSLNEMRFSLDKDLEGNQRKSKNSSLNGSSHSLIEYNNTLINILNKTQAMLKQQEQKFNNFNFNLNNRKDSSSKDNNKENLKCSSTKQHHQRHIRFLPNILGLSTDSNDAIDSPENDDLNEKLNFSHLMNKQFSIDSVDSLEFNLQQQQQQDNSASSTTSANLNNFINNSNPFKGYSDRQSFNFNNLPFTNNLPFAKQNSIPQANLLKQQLKQSINNQQNHIYHLKQRSLPSSPLFKKKLDSFERPFLPFFQNVTNMLDKHMFVNEQNSSTLSFNNNNLQNSNSNNSPINAQRMPSTNYPFSNSTTTTTTTQTISNATTTTNRTKRSKLVNNQFDSFDSFDCNVHCNGENVNETSNSIYNSNWRPERGLLNCFADSTSFDAGNNAIINSNVANTSQTNASSHQRLGRQLSDKIINEKMHNSTASRQSSCEERMIDKKLITHAQSVNNYQSSSSNASNNATEFRVLTGQLARLNLNNNNNNNNLTAINHNQSEQQYLKASSTVYEKEEQKSNSEGYCSGSISDRNSNYEEQCTNLDNNNELMLDNNELMFTTAYSNSTSSFKSSHSISSSSSSSIASSLSCSSSLVILSSNQSFRSRISQIEKLINPLPSPTELSSNAFMLFICLTILLLHRDKIINENLDANDIAIYFDSKVRKHDVHLVINIGKIAFFKIRKKKTKLKTNRNSFFFKICSS